MKVPTAMRMLMGGVLLMAGVAGWLVPVQPIPHAQQEAQEMQWYPLHVPTESELWVSLKGGTHVWEVYYPKQSNQTAFKLVGLFQGHGDVLLAYADAGDAVRIDFEAPTALTVLTEVGWGGGTVPLPLAVYLRSDDPAQPITVLHPNVLVGTGTGGGEEATRAREQEREGVDRARSE
jgi:hypothetical protein